MLKCTDIFSNITSFVKFQEQSYYIYPASRNATHTFNVILRRNLNLGVNSPMYLVWGAEGLVLCFIFFDHRMV